MAVPAPPIPRWTSAIIILCCVCEVALQLADLGGAVEPAGAVCVGEGLGEAC